MKEKNKPKKSNGNSLRENYDPHSISWWWPIVFLAAGCLIFYLIHLQDHALPPVVTLQDSEKNPHIFSGERSRVFLRKLASIGQRVVGSDENEIEAPNLFIKEIDEIRKNAHSAQEIEREIQHGSGLYRLDEEFTYVNVYNNINNVVALLKGSEGSHSILFSCHYDSVHTSRGASDDGISCSVMMELLRVFSISRTRLKHNLVFLFNGAEESGLHGSHLFLSHPWAEKCKVVLNLESAGSGGRVVLFQTGPENPWLFYYYARFASYPHTQVVGEELFEKNFIPSDTDFRIFRDFGGMAGLDFAFLRDAYLYHTRFDVEEYVPPGSHQHMGDQVLAVIKEMGNGEEFYDLESHKHGQVAYFDYLGWFLIYYSYEAFIAINIIVALLGVLSVVIFVGRLLKWSWLPQYAGLFDEEKPSSVPDVLFERTKAEPDSVNVDENRVIARKVDVGKNDNTQSIATNEKPIEGIATNEAIIEGIATNEKQIEGIATNEAIIEGIATNEATIEGIATNEAIIEGTATNDATIEGIATNEKPIEGIATNEATIEGIATNEATIEGIATNDATIEGIATNDATIEGIATNEKPIEGIATNEKPIEGIATNEGAVGSIEKNDQKIDNMMLDIDSEMDPKNKPENTIHELSTGKILIEFGIAICARIAAQGLTFGVGAAVAAFVDAAAVLAMPWYTHVWLIFPLYWCPCLAAYALIPWLVDMWREKKRMMSLSMVAQMNLIATQIPWIIIIFVMTCLGIRSSIIFMLPVLSCAVANLVIHLSPLYKMAHAWIWCYLIINLFSFLYIMYFSLLVYMLFIPIMGRSGPINNDLYIGILTVLLTLYVSSFAIPLMTVVRKQARTLIFLVVFTVVMIIIALTTNAGHPYRVGPTNPVPQRYWIMHSNREFYNESNLLTETKNGYFVMNWDRNSPRTLPHKGIRKESLKKDCEELLYCGLPTYTVRVGLIGDKSTWIPAAEPYLPYKTELKRDGDGKRCSDTPEQTDCTITFLLQGPDRMTLTFSPRNGAELLEWSLDTPIEPSGEWKNQPTYYLHIVHGRIVEDYKLTLKFKVTPSQKNGEPFLDIGLAGNHVHHDSEHTQEFKDFITTIPDWTTVSGWISAYRGYIY